MTPRRTAAQEGLSTRGVSSDAARGDTQGHGSPPRWLAWSEGLARRGRILCVLLAILLPQGVLFGPALVGRKILLPLDVLAIGAHWIAESSPEHREEAQDRFLSDLVFVTELNRRYCVDEVRSGRLPLWNPHIYCGAPFLASSHPAVFSPYRLLDYAWPGPEAVAWGQVLKALVAGFGAYLFLRRALGASFLGGLAAAALFPLCGYLILWSGFTLANVATFLPWLLWATHATLRRPIGFGGIAFALVTAAILVSGHAANAGHLFVAAWLYAAWIVLVQERGGSSTAWRGLGAVVLGTVLGFALAGPQLLPLLEYMGSSARIAARAAGRIETPALGWQGLLQWLHPYTLGSGEAGATALVDTTRFEGAAAGNAGLITTLVLLPLAFAIRERRRTALFFALLGAFALVPILGVPVLSSVFELPPFVYVRNNRFTIVTAFAVVVLGALGVDALVRGHVRPRRTDWIAIALIALLCVYGALRFAYPPVIAEAVRERAWFFRYDLLGLVTALVALACWFGLRRQGPRVLPAIALAALVELVILAFGVNPQCESALYYPPIPVLETIRARGGGRMLGVECFPPNLAQAAGLCDVRGYDAADPLRIVELLRASRNPHAPSEVYYAATLFHIPKPRSGIADALGLRWIVLRGWDPSDDTVEIVDRYSLFERKTALPRVFVPETVRTLSDKTERLQVLAADEFDPLREAIVEGSIPARFERGGRGSARLVVDDPAHVAIDVELQAPGLVVIGDCWDPGWHAEVDGVESEVVIVDHALRGVFVEGGAHRIEYRYWPRSLTIGLWMAALAGVFLCGWAVVARTRSRP